MKRKIIKRNDSLGNDQRWRNEDCILEIMWNLKMCGSAPVGATFSE